jgi:hypothetical protein
MQNEPNFRNSQMNVNKVLTKDYEKKTLGEHGKNEPKTNPNEPNFKKAKMNVTTYITKAYENKPHIKAPKKRTQFSKRQKPMQPSLLQRIMKNTALSGYEKTNPNKPNTKPIKANKMSKQTQSDSTCRGVASGEAGSNPKIIVVNLGFFKIHPCFWLKNRGVSKKVSSAREFQRSLPVFRSSPFESARAAKVLPAFIIM